jgi:hypothetical protein
LKTVTLTPVVTAAETATAGTATAASLTAGRRLQFKHFKIIFNKKRGSKDKKDFFSLPTLFRHTRSSLET